MVNSEHRITIFNLRIDKETRREVFVPTSISGVSFYGVKQLSVNARNGQEIRKEALSFKIRIPVNAEVKYGKTYVSEEQYSMLSDEEVLKHWTIQKECYIFETSEVFENKLFTMEELDLVKRYNNEEFVVVKEYADNTKRGTDATKHWRIGGV